MSCQGFDVKAYALGELTPGERTKAEQHLAGCVACREEAEQYGLTVALMRRLPQHVPPRRIAFVSDPVLEPKWWQRFFTSAPQLGFASALALAVAIVAHGALQPRPMAQGVDVAAVQREIDTRVSAEVARLLPTAVDARVRAELQPAVAAMGRRLDEFERSSLSRVKLEVAAKADVDDMRAAFELIDKKLNAQVLSAERYGGD